MHWYQSVSFGDGVQIFFSKGAMVFHLGFDSHIAQPDALPTPAGKVIKPFPPRNQSLQQAAFEAACCSQAHFGALDGAIPGQQYVGDFALLRHSRQFDFKGLKQVARQSSRAMTCSIHQGQQAEFVRRQVKSQVITVNSPVGD
jgi:hypothetical protein